MDTVNVLIGFRLEEVYQREIAAVDPRIRVIDAVKQVQAELPTSAWLPWDQRPPVEDFLQAREELNQWLGETEVMLAGRVPPNLVERAPRLKWIQLMGTGVDHIAGTGVLESPVIVTNASGVNAIPIGEYVLGLMLMFVKQAPRLFANKQAKRWDLFAPSELYGKTAGVVGLGSIGEQLARLAKAFGMRVVATRRSAVRRELGVGDADELYPRSDLLDLLAVSDFVVISVPLTRETMGMIGEPELRAMKSTSYLINISRGQVINEPTLIRALKEGWIAGAGLDVFETEPLPPGSELWGLPNVILSPHIAGVREMYGLRITELFCENIRRYLAGQELLNVVDKERGY